MRTPEELVGKYVSVGTVEGGYFVGVLQKAGSEDPWWVVETEEGEPAFIAPASVRSVRVTRTLAEIQRKHELEGLFTPSIARGWQR